MTISSAISGTLIAATVAGSASQAGVSAATSAAQIANGWAGVKLNEASLDAGLHKEIVIPPITGG